MKKAQQKWVVIFWLLLIFASFLPQFSKFFADPRFTIICYLLFGSSVMSICIVFYENQREGERDLIGHLFADIDFKKFILNDLVKITNTLCIFVFWCLQYYQIFNGYYNNYGLTIGIVLLEVLCLIIIRILLELVVSITRIAENTGRIKQNQASNVL